jgi:hypothetical protein
MEFDNMVCNNPVQVTDIHIKKNGFSTRYYDFNVRSGTMNNCDVCGDYCYPKQFNWDGKILCLDCFLWYANRHMIDELIPIEE